MKNYGMINDSDEHEKSDIKTNNKKPALKSEIMVNELGAAKVNNDKVDDFTTDTNIMMKR